MNYHYTLGNISEGRRFRQLRGGSLKSQFAFFKVPTLALGYPQPHSQWTRGAFSPGVKRLDFETGQSLPLSAEI
jgi:hypothetical protein